jgi:hypothetical protein
VSRCGLHLDGHKKELLDSDVFIASQLVSGPSYQHTTNDKNIIFIDSLTLVGCEVMFHSQKGTVPTSHISVRLHLFSCLEDGGSMFLRSVGKVPDCTVSNAGSLVFIEYYLGKFTCDSHSNSVV